MGTMRGFQNMTPEARKAQASRAGILAHQKGTAHEWTSEQAKAAAKKSVESRRRKKLAQQAEQDQARSGNPGRV